MAAPSRFKPWHLFLLFPPACLYIFGSAWIHLPVDLAGQRVVIQFAWVGAFGAFVSISSLYLLLACWSQKRYFDGALASMLLVLTNFLSSYALRMYITGEARTEMDPFLSMLGSGLSQHWFAAIVVGVPLAAVAGWMLRRVVHK
jgi:hypothetical protein